MPKLRSQNNTPRKSEFNKILDGSTNRVLRSRPSPSNLLMQQINMHDKNSNNKDLPLIDKDNLTPNNRHELRRVTNSYWENDKRYDFKSTNSNTNNPDEYNKNKSAIQSSFLSSSSIHLSGDEYDDINSRNDETDCDNKTVDSTLIQSSIGDSGSEKNPRIFGSNNANASKLLNTKDKSSSHWFQKNMFGLPSEESDDNRDGSGGALSSDDAFDISPVNQFNASNKKSRLRRHKQVDSNSRYNSISSGSSSKRSGSSSYSNISCSPTAVIVFAFHWLWNIITTTVTAINRRLKKFAGVTKWYYLPVAIPMAIAKSSLNFVVFYFDKIFRTNNFRRLVNLSSKQNNKNWLRTSFNIAWLLFWIFITYFVLVKLTANENSNMLNTITTTVTNGNNQIKSILYRFYNTIQTYSSWLMNFFYQIPDSECMENENVCHSLFSCGRRWSFCVFSYPARWLISKTEFVMPSVQEPDQEYTFKPITNNHSDIESILLEIQQKMNEQEKTILKYKNHLKELDDATKTKFRSIDQRDVKISQLEKDVDTANTNIIDSNKKISELADIKTKMDSTMQLMKGQQVTDQQTLWKSVNEIKKKMQTDMEYLINLIETKTDKSGKLDGEIQTGYNQFKLDLNQLTADLKQLKSHTAMLEKNHKSFVEDSKNFRKEVMLDVDSKLNKLLDEHKEMKKNIHGEISQLEMKLNTKLSGIGASNQQGVLSDREMIVSIIDTHINNMKSNIKDEINSTLWDQVENNIRSTIASTVNVDSSSSPKQTISFNPDISGQSCGCPLSSCRCPPVSLSGCVRLNHVRKLVDDALQIYSADKIGRADFALESAGGTIASTRCTETYTGRAATLTVLGIPVLRMTNSPRIIIQPSLNPGECWAMKGSTGSVVIQLSGLVEVNAISIDHIPKALSPSGSIDSAIKEFEVKALQNEKDENGNHMGNFTYNINSDPIQTFLIAQPIKTNFVELSIKSNHGNKEYTCIYRVRVHGTLINN